MNDSPLPAEILTNLFPDARDSLGTLSVADPAGVPEVYRRLLDHDHHMTVTVEAHHRSSVTVRVLEWSQQGHHYSRRITLQRTSDGATVQYGIVRLHLDLLDAPVRNEILAADAPLGHVLIRHQVFRRVARQLLYKVNCGPELAALFRVPLGTETYGRTALIFCDDEPAIELLEIVSPESALR